MTITNEIPTTEETINTAIDAKLLEVRVSLPGRIEKYDAATQKADVQPLLQRETKAGELLTMPIITDVPVHQLRTKTAGVYLPVNPGDTGVLTFHDRSLDNWLLQGGISNPDDNRFHDISDASFVIGLYPFSEPGLAEADNLFLHNGSSFHRILPSGKHQIGNSANELLSILDELIDEIDKTIDENKKVADADALITVNTVVGTSTIPNNAATFILSSVALVSIKATVATIKAKLATLLV